MAAKKSKQNKQVIKRKTNSEKRHKQKTYILLHWPSPYLQQFYI